ncbi:hypothetical protein Tco_0414211 [Tanacetum coccineum]
MHLNDASVSLTYKPIDTPSVIVHFESTSESDASASLTAGGDLGKCYSKESVPQQKDDEEIKMDDLIKLMPKPTQGMLGVALAVVVTDFEPLHSFGVLRCVLALVLKWLCGLVERPFGGSVGLLAMYGVSLWKIDLEKEATKAQ